MSSEHLTINGKHALTSLNKLVEKPMIVKGKNLFVKIFFPKSVTVSFYNTIQVSDGKQIDDDIVFHEFQHYLDRCKLVDEKYSTSFLKSTWWYLKYLSPTIISALSLFSLLAIPFSKWFLLFMIFSLFIIPITSWSTFRLNAEIRGYFWNSMFHYNVNYSKIFSSFKYYYMDYTKSNVFYLKVFSIMSDENVHDVKDNMSSMYSIYREHMVYRDKENYK